MFHMPCFFFISGYLLNDKYLIDLKTGLIQKAKNSYYPFVKWTLIFLAFHNVFYSLHIYETSYSWQTFIERIIRAFTLSGSESLLGGFWFLISLFWASTISLLFLNVLLRKNLLSQNAILIGIIGVLIIATFWHYIPINLPQMFGVQTLLAIVFYLSGYFFCKKNVQFNYSLLRGFSLLLIPAIAAFFIKLDMTEVQGWHVLVYYLIAMAGIIGIILIINELLKYNFVSILIYIGNKTLYILIFHFLAFKLISFIYLYFNDLSIDLLTEFPVLEKTNSWIWIAYTIGGICFPLVIWELAHQPLEKNKRSQIS